MRLYTVTITTIGMVLAESEEAARWLGDEILNAETYDPSYALVRRHRAGYQLPRGWTQDACVYHDGDEDISVRDAIKIHEADHD